MDLRQARYFVAVAEELNFTRAASRCAVSQPPLSRAIALLEHEVGGKLFERDKHRVALTPLGREFLSDARRIIALVGSTMKKARQMAHGEGGLIVVGLGGTMIYSLIPRLVLRFKQRYPDVEFAFRSLPVPYQMAALRDGDIDVGIVRLPVEDDVVETVAIHSEEIVLAIPSAWADQLGTGDVRLADLRDYPFVTYQAGRGNGAQTDLLLLCREVGFEPTIRHQVVATDTVLGIVGCCEGVAVVPASAKGLHVSGVEFRHFADEAFQAHPRKAQFALAWHSQRVSPVLHNFVTLTREAQEEVVALR